MMQKNNHNHCDYILGLDIGTSGIRGTLVEKSPGSMPVSLFSAECELPLPRRQAQSGQSIQDAAVWLKGLESLFNQLSASEFWSGVRHIVADATSSTVLLCDSNGSALTSALMYDDTQAVTEAKTISERIKPLAVPTAATGASSTLAKALLLRKQIASQARGPALSVCHQIDVINRYLLGHACATDENNALKLGYDPVERRWPEWVKALAKNNHQTELALPEVVRPGTTLGTVSPEIAARWKLSTEVRIHAGTTDSIAGFLASGAERTGDAVTSLGSTLAVKLLSDQPVFNADYGLYSHRLGDRWLVGGASNTGGAVLLKYFDLEELKSLLSQLESDPLLDNPDAFVTDAWYPLMRRGERFPIADAGFGPRLPQPPLSADDEGQKRQFLFALLQGLTHVETLAYQRLEELGCPPLKRLFSVGGGTRNRVWKRLRKVSLPVDQPSCFSQDASYGVTRLVGDI